MLKKKKPTDGDAEKQILEDMRASLFPLAFGNLRKGENQYCGLVFDFHNFMFLSFLASPATCPCLTWQG